MAKPIHTAKLSEGMRAGKAAGLVLEARIADVREHAPSAILGEATGIFDLRVSVKRLRETMRLFRRLLPTRRCQRAMPLVELLNDCLGRVREPDVLCIDAEVLQREIEDDGGLIATAICSWKASREESLTDLLTVWSRLSSDGLFDTLDQIARRAPRRGRNSNRMSLDRFKYEAIRRAMGRVDARLGPAIAHGDPERLHNLRIAVKRLKYSMEPFRLMALPLRGPWKVVSQAQEVLGGMHDLDVLRERLGAHLGAVDADRRDAAEEVLALLDARRGEKCAQARGAIGVFADPRFTRLLLDAID